jgi:hypothetical protein
VGDNTFTVDDWSATVRLSGLAGNDTYAFGPGGFGIVEIVGGSDTGTDTLDFTALGAAPGLTVTKTTIDNDTITGAGGTITHTGVIAEEIDATLANVDITTLQAALDDLLDFVRQIKEAPGALQALRNQLPLLDRGQASGLADVVALTGAFEKFVTDAKTKISGKVKLSTVVEALNTLSADWLSMDLPAPLRELTLTVATSYRGEDPDIAGGVDDRLELLLDFSLHAEASKEFDIDLGETAENLRGIGIDGTVAADGTLQRPPPSSFPTPRSSSR